MPGSDDEGLIAIIGALVFTSPGAEPIDNGVVIVLDGFIEAVGERGEVAIPGGARRVNANGHALLAGFWNADVWIDDEVLDLAGEDGEEEGADQALALALQERFTRYGFTTVVDTGSDPMELDVLLDRLVVDGVPGPRVLSAGGSLPAGVHQSGWWHGMDLSGGVGLEGMPAGDVALIPALTLASVPGEQEAPDGAHRRLNDGIQAIRGFVAQDGPLVFGTGSGYVPEYDPSGEFVLLDEAGVSFPMLLNALTAEPANRFGHTYTGILEPGMVADMVLVEGDPSSDLSALERVRWVLVEGRTVYDAMR